MKLPVDADRLRADIERNATFGAIEYDEPDKRGRTNRTGTPTNRRARDYLTGRMEAAGLDVTVDSVGNIAGRWTPPSADPDRSPIASGSHLDSVPEGGIFDGPLGVYAALEAVRTMQDAGVEPDRPVLVVSFTEEEGGTYADGLLGSTVAAGEMEATDALGLTDAAGDTLEEALSRIGYRGEGRLDPTSWAGFYELHIEQDTALEREGADVGVVTAITGITHCQVELKGEANHAGATAMDARTDALAAASEFVLDVERAATDVVESESETAVATVGSFSISPNATNVVPGRVEAGVDIRDVRRESIERIVTAGRESLARLERERNVKTTVKRPFDVEPESMSDRLRAAAHASADAVGAEAIDIHSGAAHDAMRIAQSTDAAMLFAPSRDGISHNPREWTDWDACATATTVLTGAIARAAGMDAR
ncbi:Zn-dependent hydrolase [Halorubrum vacuolatum]|uniref:N-carbamoyl-L-amino-acid hydrolase n=1 Tax=Halorubrum vacuolatum TaxID=63740 RepID=A0A238VEZ5_HALVU|nr:Zn-dependent hydrolase [Halorubrum vacuolatum]SNR32791.1 N-carbamoyl-L-amino-acid hydrolase [Halorubrum vacuolatum]